LAGRSNKSSKRSANPPVVGCPWRNHGDIDLAAASDAVIIGFNTTLASGARIAADAAGVDVREYSIIYKLLEDIQAALEGLLEPEMVEEPLGTVEVRAVFPVGKGAVAGALRQAPPQQQTAGASRR